MLEAFGLSDPGCIRSNNEDYFISDSEAGIFILADGMGGANAGEFASRISAEMLYEFLLMPENNIGNGSLEQGFVEANRAVRQAAKTDPSLEGMGSTLLAARALNEGEVEVGSVGDSRAWSYRRKPSKTSDAACGDHGRRKCGEPPRAFAPGQIERRRSDSSVFGRPPRRDRRKNFRNNA